MNGKCRQTCVSTLYEGLVKLELVLAFFFFFSPYTNTDDYNANAFY